MTTNGSDLGRLLGYGAATAALYFLLFFHEDAVLELTSKGGWTFLAPVAFAFVISYAHGGFTATFWDVLGIRAKK